MYCYMFPLHTGVHTYIPYIKVHTVCSLGFLYCYMFLLRTGVCSVGLGLYSETLGRLVNCNVIVAVNQPD